MEASFYITAPLAFAILVVLYFIGASKGRRLLPPGPLALPIIGHLYLLKPPAHQALAKLSAQYGPLLLLRFGSLRVLVVSSPEIAEECFTTNDLVFANRPPLLFFKHFGFNDTAVVAAPYGDLWRNLRRIAVLEILSVKRINALSGVRTSELCNYLRRLYKEASASSTVELSLLLNELAVNTTMRMLTGKSYYGEGATAGVEESGRFRNCVLTLANLTASSSLEDFVPLWKWFSGLEKEMVSFQKTMDILFQEMIEERRREMELCAAASESAKEIKSEDRKTIIQVMLEMQKVEPDYYTDEIIKGMIMSLLAAGTETSSATITWTMANLLNHPTVLEKAQKEIDTHVSQRRIVTDDDLPKLQYLQNIVKEALRLFPPAPLLVPHFSTDDCVVAGYNVPRNTMLLVNAYCIQRNPELWIDPNEFKPERYEADHGHQKNIPFGLGRRRCPGETLGIKTVMLTLANLIKCFEWERVGKEMVDMEERDGLTLGRVNPLFCKYKPRPTMTDVLAQL